MTYTVTVSHVDTCLSDYLQDHHNREGECLIGIPVDGDATYGAVFKGLVEAACGDERIAEDVTDEKVVEAIIECFKGIDLTKLFDPTLDVIEEPNYGLMNPESVQAWFLVQWEQD
jgi:hypothetical protein